MTIHTLWGIIRRISADIVFLMETKEDATFLDLLKARLHFDSCSFVDVKGLKGGLRLFWQNDNVVLVTILLDNLIHLLYKNKDGSS